MDQELQELIIEYVKKIEAKESDINLIKIKVNNILDDAKKETEILITNLDIKFNENKISEGEYLIQLREEKDKILNIVKNKLSQINPKDMENKYSV